jgi:predicted phage terminase large subunit-like protein
MNLSKDFQKLELATALLEQKRREIKKDPWLLSKILYPKYEFKDFHREWFYNALDKEEDLCLAPRKFAKTTVRAIINSIWDMIKNPNIQIGLCSDTNSQAVHFGRETKMHCERNKDLIALYPYLAPGKIWSDNEFTIIGATEIQKGATVTAFGYGQATGYEFDKLMIDDIVDFENVRTKYQRDKLEDWIGMGLRPMLKAGGKISWSGTRYHQNDQYGRLLEKGINTNIKSHKAILDNGESMWPELWPIKILLDKKGKMGSMSFDAQYQNDVKLMALGKIFKREWFKYIRRDPNNPSGFIRDDGVRINIKDLAIYQTCDLAISKKETADYFVILTFGVDKEGNIYILDVIRGRYDWPEQKRISRQNYLKWKELGLRWRGIESVQYQAVLSQELNTFVDMSIRTLTTMGLDKVTRAMPMSAKYESGKVYHNANMEILQDFEDELTAFNEGENDDMVDTTSYIPQCVTREKATIRVA